VETWLEQSRLVPPRLLDLNLVVTDEPWTGEDGRRVLRQPLLTYYYGPPDDLIRLVWHDGLGPAVLAPGSASADAALKRSLAEKPET